MLMALLPRGRGGQAERLEESRPLSRAGGGFRVSMCFPTPSLAKGTAAPSARLALSPEPQNYHGGTRAGALSAVAGVEKGKDGAGDIPPGQPPQG